MIDVKKMAEEYARNGLHINGGFRHSSEINESLRRGFTAGAEAYKAALLVAMKRVVDLEEKYTVKNVAKSGDRCPKCACATYSKTRAPNNPVCQCLNCGFQGEDWQFEPKEKLENKNG